MDIAKIAQEVLDAILRVTLRIIKGVQEVILRATLKSVQAVVLLLVVMQEVVQDALLIMTSISKVVQEVNQTEIVALHQEIALHVLQREENN